MSIGLEAPIPRRLFVSNCNTSNAAYRTTYTGPRPERSRSACVESSIANVSGREYLPSMIYRLLLGNIGGYPRMYKCHFKITLSDVCINSAQNVAAVIWNNVTWLVHLQVKALFWKASWTLHLKCLEDYSEVSCEHFIGCCCCCSRIGQFWFKRNARDFAV